MPDHIRQAVVAEARSHRGPDPKAAMPKGSWPKVLEVFAQHHVSERSARRWLADYDQQRAAADVDVANINVGAKRKGRDPTNVKFTVAIGRRLIEIDEDHGGALSYADLAAKLNGEGVECCEESVRVWSLALGSQRRRVYLKPMLRYKHMYDRLDWVLNELDFEYDEEEEVVVSDGTLTDNKNTVHIDEKWFYLRHDGKAVRVYPDENGEFKMPTAGTKVYHKSRMPKLMFCAAVARPRPEYEFDGKVGIFFFGFKRKAKRGNKLTGTIAGVTDILEDIKVDAHVYRAVLLGQQHADMSQYKNAGIMQAIEEKMWWFKAGATHNGAPCPEAGTKLWVQHDGAKPHTAKTTAAAIKRYQMEAAKRGFDIEVVTQPAQSPDLNMDDLSFFHSLASHVRKKLAALSRADKFDLKSAVEECFWEYESETLERCWLSIFAVYRGILTTGGDNTYSTHGNAYAGHSSVRKDARHGLADDLTVSAAVIQKAMEERDRLHELKDQELQKDQEMALAAASDDESESDSDY